MKSKSVENQNKGVEKQKGKCWKHTAFKSKNKRWKVLKRKGAEEQKRWKEQNESAEAMKNWKNIKKKQSIETG